MMPASPATRWREAREFLAGALGQLRGAERTATITLPAPLGRPSSLLELMPERPAFIWQTPYGWALAGIGAAERLEPAPGLADLRDRARERSAAILRFTASGVPETPPRFMGGLAFDPADRRPGSWDGFPDGCFILPRWSYEREDSRAILRLGLQGGLTRRIADYVEEYDFLVAGLEAGSAPRRFTAGEATPREPDPEGWRRYVEASRDAIRAGRFRKIVTARASHVELEHAIDPLALVERLAVEHRQSILFSIQLDASGPVFLGATPERLISLSGTHLATDPLAGSIATPERADEPGERERRAAALLASAKDLAEHALVVENVVAALRPRTLSLEVPAGPRIRIGRHVMHLHTPIRGEVAAPAHVLDFVEALHPTPSVGGVPTAAALAWIREREPEPRGWYGGPVGWFDAADDGEFAIALRCGLVHAKSALVYAGAGIVADSDPAAEYEETVVKQRAFLRALGAAALVAW